MYLEILTFLGVLSILGLLMYFVTIQQDLLSPEFPDLTCPDIPDLTCPKPSCPELPQPSCPKPSCPELPQLSCPKPSCPDLPDLTCPEPSCPICPEPSCPACPKCPDSVCPACPKCPDCVSKCTLPNLPDSVWSNVYPDTGWASTAIDPVDDISLEECKFHILNTSGVEGGDYNFETRHCAPRRTMGAGSRRDNPKYVAFRI